MRIIDSLLIAPTVFCVIGVLIGLVTDIGSTWLWAAVACASLGALLLHGVIALFRRPRPRGTYRPAASPRARP